MLRNNQRLTHLVDQLMDLSQLESGNLKLRVAKTKITPLLKSIVEPFEYQAKKVGLQFNVTISDKQKAVWVDREALHKIVSNLLSNALKYTTANGRIVVSALVDSRHITLVVTNTGDPLTSNQKEKLFNRFYQVDEFQQGAGIGLALTKELVELHKGDIRVENTEKGIVAFEVTLPSSRSSFKAKEVVEDNAVLPQKNQPDLDTDDIQILDVEIPEENESAPLLLIIEDNKDLRTVLQEAFIKEYRILMATDGEEGLQKAIEHVPDLIISDVMMPKKDGVSLAKELKNHELTSHVPIILLTAKTGDDNELAGIESGADDYITKPFNNALLKSKMINLLSIREKMRARYSQEVILKPKDIAVRPPDEILLGRIQSVLDVHLIESSFSTEDFAVALGFSRMQLHRKLKALIGLSATEFIRSQRLKLAAQLLEKSEANVSEVCYQSGFNNLSYFAKCFKEAYGTPPSAYSKKS